MTYDERLMKAREEFEKIITPDILEEAEQMAKHLHKISFEELHRKFTI